MKNYLLDLLKSERTSINSKELMVTKALKDSENKLDRDHKDFINFVEKEKKSQRYNEQKLLDIISNNKKLESTKKKLLQENKHVEEELDRTVKSILNLKANASFVYNVIGGKILNFITFIILQFF